MASLLDELHPETAPHKPYVAFRYVRPLTEQTARQMKADNVKRAVAFTQYPQYSCSTTGSSLNEIFRRGRAGYFGDEIEWTVIDRWGTHPGFIEVCQPIILSELQPIVIPSGRSPKHRSRSLEISRSNSFGNGAFIFCSFSPHVSREPWRPIYP